MKNFITHVFYPILFLEQTTFLLILDLGRLHPSIRPSIHPYSIYLLSTYCVPGAGVQWWHSLWPHKVGLVRKTDIKKMNLNLQILFITSGVYCNKPLVCNLFSQQNECCKTLPWGHLSFGKAEMALCTHLCIPAVTGSFPKPIATDCWAPRTPVGMSGQSRSTSSSTRKTWYLTSVLPWLFMDVF